MDRHKMLTLLVILSCITPYIQGAPFNMFGGGANPNKLPLINVGDLYDPKPVPSNSFKSPFYLVRGTVPFWAIGGATVVTDDVIKLTPAIQSKTGFIWNQKVVTSPDWEVEIPFKIWGSSGLGADGMAFWYTEQSYNGKEGPTFGGPESWNGMIVTFDTFDNDAAGDHPLISVYHNDGTWKFDMNKDGNKERELGSCRSFYRNQDSVVKIQYFDGNVQVLIKTPSTKSDFELCTRVRLQLQPQGYLGMTAATGGLADNHDIMGFHFRRLVMKGTVDRGDPEPPKPQPVPVPAADSPPKVEETHDRPGSILEQLNKLKQDNPPPTPPHQDQQQQQQPPPPQQQQPPQQQYQQPPQQQQQYQQQAPPQQQQQYQPPQQQYQQPPQQQYSGNQGDVLEQLKQEQRQLQNAVNEMKGFISSYTIKLEGQSQSITQVLNGQALLAGSIDNFKPSSDVSADVNQLNNDIRTVRDSAFKLTNNVDMANRQIDNLARLVGEIRNKLDEASRGQADLHMNLQRNQKELSDTIQQSSSTSFWIYFVLFQAVFGAAFGWYLKYSREKEKKYF